MRNHDARTRNASGLEEALREPLRRHGAGVLTVCSEMKGVRSEVWEFRVKGGTSDDVKKIERGDRHQNRTYEV